MSSSLVKFTLSNGVRVLVEPVTHVQSAAIGLWCRTGSRHETDKEAGITHLIEHMLFKGTPTRTAREIAEAIEGRGGALNAFTDKEATCYYARVLMDDVDNGIDVLSDMMLNPLLDPEELEREEKVVIQEIKRGEDEPDEHVHELHLEHRWNGHPLGKPVIGTQASVASFKRDHLQSYMDRQYRGGSVLLAVAGNVDPEAVRAKAEQSLGGVCGGGANPELDRPTGKAERIEVSKEVEQVHFCIGGDGCSLYDKEIYALAVMDGVLGGGMSSRLFQEVREKRGLAYAIGSYSLSYGAGGAFTVYGGTSLDHWPLVQELVRAEFDRLIGGDLEDDELSKIKRNLKGALVLGLEGMSGRMIRMSRNELNHQREIPVEETLSRIDTVTVEDVAGLARALLPEDCVSTTAIGQF